MSQNNHSSPTTGTVPAYYMSPMSGDDEIDLLELWNALLVRKFLILFLFILGVVVSIGIALWLPNIYTSTATLVPSEEQKGGGLSALASQFGGLASLAGVNIGGGATNDKASVAIEIANSRQFRVRFVHEHHLEVALMASNGVNKKTGELKIDSNIYDVQQQKWVRHVSEGKSAVPTDWELFKVINKLITITQDKKSGFVTVSVDFYSPQLAKQWTDWFIADLNQYMKNRDQVEAKRNIAYLKQQLEKTSVADMQTVFYQLIEEQTKTLMLSEVNPEYVFKTLDPAVVAEEKTKPKRALIVILGGILGGMFGVLIALIKYAANRRNKSVAA